MTTRCRRRRFAALLLLSLLVPGLVLGSTPWARAEGGDRGMLWRLRGPAGSVYLAGSLHVLPPGGGLPAPYERAYVEAERLVMELDAAELDPVAVGGALLQRALLPPGRSLRALVGAERWGRLEPRLMALGLPAEVLDRFEPWAASLLLASAGMAGGGFQGDEGVESRLLRRAAADRKPVSGLETLAFQLELFDGLSEAEQVAMLDQTLAEFDGLPQQLVALERAWRRGDVAELEALLERSFPRGGAAARRFLSRRNAAWLPRIEALLRRSDDTLVVVGALHLLGEEGLVEQLRRRGLAVERVGAEP
jgi:uncharacterized protein YbaP (TraB family)